MTKFRQLQQQPTKSHSFRWESFHKGRATTTTTTTTTPQLPSNYHPSSNINRSLLSSFTSDERRTFVDPSPRSSLRCRAGIAMVWRVLVIRMIFDTFGMDWKTFEVDGAEGWWYMQFPSNAIALANCFEPFVSMPCFVLPQLEYSWYLFIHCNYSRHTPPLVPAVEKNHV